jgi:hypothetical protein
MKRTTCASCGSPDLEHFLDLGETPLANRYPATVDEVEIFYPLKAAVCRLCGLAQLTEVVPDDELYGVDYGFYSGASQAQQDYHRAGAALLLDRYGEQAERLTVEVACNDGSLLGHFQEAGCRTLGIDPAAGPVKVARERGLDVIEAPLTTARAKEIRDEYGPAGLIIAYNCMAHIADLPDMLTAIRTLTDRGSVAVVEVQYLPDLLAGNMFDQIYHEHRYYYGMESLMRAGMRNDLYCVDAELVELQGGGLRMVLSPDPSAVRFARHEAAVGSERANAIMAAERWTWLRPQSFTSMQSRVERVRDHLRSIIDAELAAGRTIAGYGAAAKATTILNFCGLGPEQLQYVVDTTPYKQGRYVPGVKVPIVSPEHAAAHPVDTMLLLVTNYLGAVLRANPHQGRWIVPLPTPAVI